MKHPNLDRVYLLLGTDPDRSSGFPLDSVSSLYFEVGDNRPPVSVLSELSRRPLIEELWSTVQEWELGFTLILRAFGGVLETAQ